MTALLNDARIKPCIRDWVNNNLRAGANSAVQLIKSKEGMASAPVCVSIFRRTCSVKRIISYYYYVPSSILVTRIWLRS